MNQMETVSHGTFLRSKPMVTVAIEFLNWLYGLGVTLEELRQDHLDAWLADGPSTRRLVDRFLPWAVRCRLVGPDLTIARHRRGTSPKLSASEQGAVVERVVHNGELSMRDRAAAILVIVFGQHIENVVQLIWNDIIVADDVVTIRLGKAEFALPSPPEQTHAPTRCNARKRARRCPPEQQLGLPRLLPPVSTFTAQACGTDSRRCSVLAWLDSEPSTSSPNLGLCRSSPTHSATTRQPSNAIRSAPAARTRDISRSVTRSSEQRSGVCCNDRHTPETSSECDLFHS